MRIVFTMNVTRVLNEVDIEIETTDAHYKRALEGFREQMKDSEHELVFMDDGDHLAAAYYYEMEDIDSVCDVCDTSPCRCE